MWSNDVVLKVLLDLKMEKYWSRVKKSLKSLGLLLGQWGVISSNDLRFVRAAQCRRPYSVQRALTIHLLVSSETSTTHFESDFNGSQKNTWHSDGFSHRISKSPNTSQSFVLKVNTTLSCVTGNTAQPLTTTDSLLARPGVKQITVWSHTPTCVYRHTHANALKCVDTRHAQMSTQHLIIPSDL